MAMALSSSFVTAMEPSLVPDHRVHLAQPSVAQWSSRCLAKFYSARQAVGLVPEQK